VGGRFAIAAAIRSVDGFHQLLQLLLFHLQQTVE
jgi:hypothetical protein